MKRTINTRKRVRNSRRRITRKRQHGSGLFSAVAHRAHSAVNTVATVGKMGLSRVKYLPPPIKFFNKFDDLSDLKEPNMVKGINHQKLVMTVNDGQKAIDIDYLKKKFSPYNFALGSEQSSVTSSWGTADNYVMKLKKELNAYIFTAIKQLYKNAFGVEIDKYSGDNAYLTNYIFSTNRSGNGLYFRFFYKINISKEQNILFNNVDKQRIFWINLYNLLKVYCSSEENESIPCLQIKDDETFYCIYVNNNKSAKTRSIQGIIEIPNAHVLHLVGKPMYYHKLIVDELNKKRKKAEEAGQKAKSAAIANVKETVKAPFNAIKKMFTKNPGANEGAVKENAGANAGAVENAGANAGAVEDAGANAGEKAGENTLAETAKKNIVRSKSDSSIKFNGVGP